MQVLEVQMGGRSDSTRRPASEDFPAAKRAIDEGCELPQLEGLAVESECYALTLPTTDRLEALAAFAEKRKPVFKGE